MTAPSAARTRITEFFTHLYARPDGSYPEGFVSLWCLPQKESIHLKAEDPDWIAENVLEADANDQDVYFGVSLRREDLGSHRRGSKSDVALVPGLWVDIDIAGPGHAAGNLPPTFSDAVDLLDAVPLDPTMVVDSGGGLHAYWLFTDPVTLGDGDGARRAWLENLNERLQHLVRQAAGARGWHCDMLADVTRVLRVPGSTNRKVPTTPRPCYVIDNSGPKHTLEDVVRVLGAPPVPASTSAAAPGAGASGNAPTGTSGAPAHGDTPSAPHAPSAAPGTAAGPAPSDAEVLARLRDRLRTIKREESKALIRKVLAGDAFAQPGERDSTLQKVASIIAFVDHTSPPEQLAEVLRNSLETMALDSDDAPTLEEAADKIRRAQNDARERKAAEAEANSAITNTILKQARARQAAAMNVDPASLPATPYTDAELDAIAAAQRCTRAELDRRWIIQRGTAFFLLTGTGHYKPPVTRDELAVAMPQDLALSPVQFTAYKADGGLRKKRVEEILEEHATVARHLVSDLALERSYYDPASETFYEAVCPVRPIKAAFDPVIQEWLERLGGTERDKLLDWIATVTFLDKQTAALYLSGPPGTGKTLLVMGLARLWNTGGPSELGRVLEQFNSCLTRCPLIFADEHLPLGKKNHSAELRQLVGSDSRTLSRKFLPTSELSGCIRLVLAANNDRMLAFNEDLSAHDLEAVAGRFLHVDTSRAAGYLAGLGGRAATSGWVDGDKIAAHALWLRENRKVTPSGDGRFLVSGTATRVHRQLATHGRISGLVCEWLAKFLEAPPSLANVITGKRLAIVGNGELLVNTLAVTENWNLFIASEKVPTTTMVGRALSNLSREQRRIGVGGARFHVVNTDLVFDWAEANQIGDVDAMKQLVATGKRGAASAVAAAAPTLAQKVATAPALPNGFPASAAPVFGPAVKP